jgi:hypothetical protein
VSETRTVSFSVEGAFITEKAREMLLSEMPGKAWRLITMGLIGEGGAKAAQGILDGTHRLDGVDYLTLVEEDPDDPEVQRYLKDLRYIYAGRIRINGCWYRPSGRCRPTMKAVSWADSISPLREERAIETWNKRIGSFFAYDGEIVRVVRAKDTSLKGACTVLWEPCGERPFWWDEHRAEFDALQEFEEVRGRLDFRDRKSEDVKEASVALDAQAEKLMEDSRVASREARQRAEEERWDRWEKKCVEIGKKVREQAGDDVFELHIEEQKDAFKGDQPARTVMVPRAPFWHWALGRTSLKDHAPPWTPVSPSGMKLQNDNEYHTDWMLGAGLDIAKDYGYATAVTDAAMKESWRIQEMLSFKVGVLVDSGDVLGVVGKEILVLPNLSPQHAEAAMAPGVRGIITEAGGELAHLSVIGREQGWTIMRHEAATDVYKPGAKLLMMPGVGEIVERSLPE